MSRQSFFIDSRNVISLHQILLSTALASVVKLSLRTVTVVKHKHLVLQKKNYIECHAYSAIMRIKNVIKELGMSTVSRWREFLS
jgi:hypothetical protein